MHAMPLFLLKPIATRQRFNSSFIFFSLVKLRMAGVEYAEFRESGSEFMDGV